MRQLSADGSIRRPIPKWVARSVWIFATVPPLLALSRQSFWIDEALTASFTRISTLPLLAGKMASAITSEVQMPVYIFYMWSWQQVFGSSEIAMRLANYPWFLLGQIAGAFIWIDRRKGLIFVAVAACSPFLWLYLNEARPYIMEYGSMCVVLWFLASLLREASPATWKYWAFFAGLFVLAGAHMLGALWVCTAMAAAAFLVWKNGIRPPRVVIALGMAALAALALYYVWKLLGGARATYAQQTLLNVLYVAYELCGFTGLGPGRLMIREQGVASFQPFLLPLSAFAVVLLALIPRLRDPSVVPEVRTTLAVTAIVTLPPVLLLSSAGAFVQFSVLGRHVMPAIPFVFTALTLAIFAAWQRRSVWSRAVVLALFGLSIASCVGLRFLPWHWKDDYRGAVQAVSARLPANQIAWWCASEEGADYYHAPTGGGSDANGRQFVHVRNPTRETLEGLPPPAVIALSKIDVYDEHGTISAMLREQQFVRRETLPAFTIWTRPEIPLPSSSQSAAQGDQP